MSQQYIVVVNYFLSVRAVVVACAVLHNIVKLWREPDVGQVADQQDVEEPPFQEQVLQLPDRAAGVAHREAPVAAHFTN